MSSTSLAFGQQRVGTSSTRTIALKNNGPTTLSVPSVAISGSGGAAFSVTPSSFTLAPWASQTLLVAFSPTAQGNFEGTLTFTTSDPTTPTLSIPLSGTGVRPILVVEPAPLHFGEQRVGTSSAPLIAMVRNAGTGPLTLLSLSISGGTAFSVASPTMPYTLAPGMSMGLPVHFHPTAEGLFSGTLSLATSDPEYSSISVPLMGIGVMPRLVVEPAPLDFGGQNVGTTALRSVRLRNIGSGSLVISSAALSGGPFFLTAPPIMPLTLPAGASQEFMVGFSPTHVGTVTGVLSLATNDVANPMFAIPLTGVGVGSEAGLVFEPSSLDFGTQSVGTSSTRVVTVTNVSFGPLFLTSQALTASVYPSFSSTTLPAIPFYLSPGSSLNFLVTFNPGDVGSVTGTLQLTTNEPLVSGATLPLSGSGVSTLLGGL
ncbi:choice-of-anchor D domain-containing protein [Archangium sp. Cb G35]|uniref:choice-of-anchor D domain-containing protein n=1 Tax=Archangium sp. Cb G35 TaxID=1920190 RepID=UPI001300ED37|nr:choice-of-anchor D domain-containing protein [Archangium sp. Cb G35]